MSAPSSPSTASAYGSKPSIGPPDRQPRTTAAGTRRAAWRPPSANRASATNASASQSPRMYAVSSPVRCQLIGVRRHPARVVAASTSAQSPDGWRASAPPNPGPEAAGAKGVHQSVGAGVERDERAVTMLADDRGLSPRRWAQSDGTIPASRPPGRRPGPRRCGTGPRSPPRGLGARARAAVTPYLPWPTIRHRVPRPRSRRSTRRKAGSPTAAGDRRRRCAPGAGDLGGEVGGRADEVVAVTGEDERGDRDRGRGPPADRVRPAGRRRGPVVGARGVGEHPEARGRRVGDRRGSSASSASAMAVRRLGLSTSREVRPRAAEHHRADPIIDRSELVETIEPME